MRKPDVVVPTSGFGTNVTHARYNYRATMDSLWSSVSAWRLTGREKAAISMGWRDGWFIE